MVKSRSDNLYAQRELLHWACHELSEARTRLRILIGLRTELGVSDGMGTLADIIDYLGNHITDLELIRVPEE